MFNKDNQLIFERYNSVLEAVHTEPEKHDGYWNASGFIYREKAELRVLSNNIDIQSNKIVDFKWKTGDVIIWNSPTGTRYGILIGDKKHEYLSNAYYSVKQISEELFNKFKNKEDISTTTDLSNI